MSKQKRSGGISHAGFYGVRERPVVKIERRQFNDKDVTDFGDVTYCRRRPSLGKSLLGRFIPHP